MKYWILAALWAALIFVLSHQSGVPGGDVIGWIPDYVLHFVEYAVLAATMVWGATRGLKLPLSPVAAWVLVLLAALYGASDEFHQYFVPGRSTAFSDWVADCLGAGTTVAVFRMLPWNNRASKDVQPKIS